MSTENETPQAALKRRIAQSGSSLPPETARLARAVLSLPDSTLTCETCRGQLPAYVEAEISGLPVLQHYADVKHHLDECTECGADYIALLQLALDEDVAPLPASAHPPAPDLSFLPPLTLSEFVRALTEEIVLTIAPNLLEELHTIADFFFERVAALQQSLKFGTNMAPALGFGAGDTPDALKLLTATYVATQALISNEGLRHVEPPVLGQQLSAMSQTEAQSAAREVRLNVALAQRFTRQYATLVNRDAGMLQQLIVRRS